MEIKINGSTVISNFGDVLYGDLFVYEEQLYVRYDSDLAIVPGSKHTKKFHKECRVTRPSKIEVTI